MAEETTGKHHKVKFKREVARRALEKGLDEASAFYDIPKSRIVPWCHYEKAGLFEGRDDVSCVRRTTKVKVKPGPVAVELPLEAQPVTTMARLLEVQDILLTVQTQLGAIITTLEKTNERHTPATEC